ncbi:MAG: undecaprenyl-diphosphatase [Coriobacteriaceae bacterium]|nr:undecaprenyl-diphosphatase [Coriobacteriaceae bacterium]
MGLLQAVALGFVQGATEFLPVSSDGHLALVYRAFGSAPDLTFEVFLHFATLLAMLVYFRSDLMSLLRSLTSAGKGSAERRLALRIAGGTVLTGAVALALEPLVEPMSASGLWLGVWFLTTAALLAVGEFLGPRVPRTDGAQALTWPRTTLVALLQGLAVLPGLSRSGSTIAGGMLAGLRRDEAARFSFLLGIPIITLAAAKDAVGIASGTVALPGAGASAAGFVVAGVTGYLAVWGLLALVKRHSLMVFSVYTAVVGTALLIAYFAA